MYSNEMIKKFCRVSLFAMAVGLGSVTINPTWALLPQGSANATGPVPLNQAAKAAMPAVTAPEEKPANDTSASEIPDEIALFDDGMDIPTPGNGMITPNNGPEQSSDDQPTSKPATDAPDLGMDLPTPGQAEQPNLAAPTTNAPMVAPMDNGGNTPAAPKMPTTNNPAENVGKFPSMQPGNPLMMKAQAPQTEQDILSAVDNDLFNQMSDIEKQTALLTLELRREKIRTEIDAMKAQRQKAIEEQKNMDAERENKRLAMEKELEQKIIEEQTKLRKVELAYEKLRQERLLNAYKEHMLEEEQKWIQSNQEIYDQIANQKKEQELLTTKYKEKLKNLVSLSENVVRDAQVKMEAYKREVNDLQTQISILKARMEAQQKTNPFGQGTTGSGGIVVGGNGQQTPAPVKRSINLGDLYVIMEITGQNDDINAKLMNREGQTFLVKKGTKLKSGDVVTEITPTHITTENEGEESYLYFASGGVMESEPDTGSAAKRAMAARGALTGGNVSQANPRGLVTSKGVPGVSRDMMLR